MDISRRTFGSPQPARRLFARGDAVVVAVVLVVVLGASFIAQDAAEPGAEPPISTNLRALPMYALYSIGRMAAAYVLSLSFSLTYGWLAARNRTSERILLPILDVLQSMPILSFLPVVILSLAAVMPTRVAAEVASIVLIFTSQAWNITFSWYQSLSTIPRELDEACGVFRLNAWQRFRTLLLPFGAQGLIWNSMLGWAGGWFFLMAAEMFAVGDRHFQLPGLGAFLQEAAINGDVAAQVWGLVTLTVVIVVLDQCVWRPLLAWADRFKFQMIQGDLPPTSWVYDSLRSSWLLAGLHACVLAPAIATLDAWAARLPPPSPAATRPERTRSPLRVMGLALLGAALLGGGVAAVWYASYVTAAQWAEILLGVLATAARVAAALVLSLAWTVPVGVAIGTNRRVATVLQPIVQIAASLPPTAFFPLLMTGLVLLPGGLDFGAVILMLLGTQWYVLFNVIAGASAIPNDLLITARVLQLSPWQRWRTLILPTLFPYLVTGLVNASGGAWNASIVAEYVEFGGQVHDTTGIGATIAAATAAGELPFLYAATVVMILAVVSINRFVWRRLYRVAETRFRLE